MASPWSLSRESPWNLNDKAFALGFGLPALGFRKNTLCCRFLCDSVKGGQISEDGRRRKRVADSVC